MLALGARFRLERRRIVVMLYRKGVDLFNFFVRTITIHNALT